MDSSEDKSKSKISRKEFISGMGIFATAYYKSKLPIIAGPFTEKDEYNNGIPVEKKIKKDWKKSLYERGQLTTYCKSQNELKYIGMPVGGIMAGTMYLSGDGRLWLWDIFNEHKTGIDPKTVEWNWKPFGSSNVTSPMGSAYIEPPPSSSKFFFEQGFAVKILMDGKEFIKQLREEDWDEITFTGTYPVAEIKYTDSSLKVSIKMEAFSPFIPLDDKNSSLPSSIFSIKIINESQHSAKVELIGWLENACFRYNPEKHPFKKRNTVIKDAKSTSVFLEAIEDTNSKKAGLSRVIGYGSMCITLFKSGGDAYPDFNTEELTKFDFKRETKNAVEKNEKELLTGGVGSSFHILPNQNKTYNFAISWYFANTKLPVEDSATGNYYTKFFKNALDVSNYIARERETLFDDTILWKDTWYDSTLPYWFLERTFSNTCNLATSSCHRFSNGRFWAWEGVGCCAGTCTHVWSYAQAMARIFPGIEKEMRERVDLGLAFDKETGMIGYRGEDTGPAIDGQAGVILRIYREHQMSKDNSFLKNNWPHIRLAIQYILNHDHNGDGIIDGAQPNTLDAAWYGEISWITSLCLAAWKAGAKMADEVGDKKFAKICTERFLKGKKNVEDKLFNGEYFIQIPGKDGKDHLGSYDTCEIDQVYGQSWAFQVGLGRILNKEKVLSALKSLWKYNYLPDVGPYIMHHPGGRPYAIAGDGGMLMDSNPHKDPEPYGKNITWQAAYFHECMSGFEHQVASHMMGEGMIDEALILTRTIHDRYNGKKRNPFNEIECSDHYSRAMASYGTFITACGFEYDGPKGIMSFNPKISPNSFKAPFTSAEGWGTYSQRKGTNGINAQIEMKYGKLVLTRFGIKGSNDLHLQNLRVVHDGSTIDARLIRNGEELEIEFAKAITIEKKQKLIIAIS